MVLYIPGLGDHRLKLRRRAINTWHYNDIQIKIVPKQWRVDETWRSKLDRLIKKIDTYHAKGMLISLIGESAGATAVLAALEERTDKVHAVILLCGKSQYPDRVAPSLYKKNPALAQAMMQSHEVVNQLTDVQKQKVLNLHPVWDPVVPLWETKIVGVKDSYMPMIGHFSGIGFGITLWQWRIVRFIRSLK